MKLPRVPTWLPLTGLVFAMAAVLGGLLLVMANDREGMIVLPGQADGAGGRESTLVECLADEVGGYSFAEVLARPQDRWTRWNGRGRDYVRSLHGEAVWVRVTLRNPGDATLRGVVADAEYYVDRLEAWTRDGTAPDGWRHERAGEWTPASEKALWGRDAGFLVEVPPRGETVVYLRAQDHFGVWMRPLWWPDARRFFAAQTRGLLAEGVYFGVMLALLIYNSVLWLRLRFVDIGHYLGYLASVAVFMGLARAMHQVAGFAMGSPKMETASSCALALAGMFMASFARKFFDLRKVAPRMDLVARGLVLMMGVLAAGALTMPWAKSTIWLHAVVLCTAVTHGVLLAAALVAWRAGATQARYFVYSFGVFFVGVAPTAAIWLQAIPLGLSAMAMMTGSALEMLLLSLALADRFAALNRDKLAAQARAVEEAERRRAIQEAYADELEVEVRERTRELEAANADKDRMLAVLGHDLRSPLTGLTRTAEQAATGHASGAVFAAEAARTGRALLLMIEDLVLWARLRAGSVHLGRHPAGALVASAVAQHRAVAERGGVVLVVDAPAGLAVETDLVLAQTLVRNLLANALRFSRSRVELRVAAAGGAVRVTVRDDGPGLPPAMEAALARESPGAWPSESGLGLRLCAEIGRALKTRLEVRPPEGGGTEFGFTLTAAVTARTEAEKGVLA